MSALGKIEERVIPQVKVWREFDAAKISVILNDPAVRPWIADAAEGVIDVSKQMENPEVAFLMGEHGGVMLHRFMPGFFEVHTFCLPQGRGAWVLGMIRAAQHWLFTNTDAYEVLTRIPETHKAALGLTIKAGMTYEFTRFDGVKINDQIMPVDIYSLKLWDWVKKAPRLVERGAQFHDWLTEQAAKAGFVNPHEDDENHNRYVGAVLEMLMHGQPLKGVLFYNRWAVISRHAPITLIAVDPPEIKMDIGNLKLANGELEFLPWKKTLN